jgi:hypothetical protein
MEAIEVGDRGVYRALLGSAKSSAGRIPSTLPP